MCETASPHIHRDDFLGDTFRKKYEELGCGTLEQEDEPSSALPGVPLPNGLLGLAAEQLGMPESCAGLIPDPSDPFSVLSKVFNAPPVIGQGKTAWDAIRCTVDLLGSGVDGLVEESGADAPAGERNNKHPTFTPGTQAHKRADTGSANHNSRIDRASGGFFSKRNKRFGER